MIVFRNKAKNFVFASVIEPHGYFNESTESSLNARGVIEKIEVVGHNDKATVVNIYGVGDFKWQIIVNNQNSDKTKTNKARIGGKIYKWVGDFNLTKES